ncbi:MAG: hypothetical protein HN353_02690 [Bdellovibrionales bacterium]|jgi:hypothetical protein|nr:hypothetical protein [Bdellovibrionales bacterium]MBT3525594.1 hypothetical protein [Bdellovibrionales bacterium]
MDAKNSKKDERTLSDDKRLGKLKKKLRERLKEKPDNIGLTVKLKKRSLSSD